jgi:hypothetical protein
VSLVRSDLTEDSSREAFTIENQQKTKQFSAFGFDFSCSVFQTFCHQTDTPIGVVTSSDGHCFGPLGTRASSATELQQGLISLSLRRQWLISIPDAGARQLAAGAPSATASVVAFFDPYLTRSRKEQIADLEIDLASGTFVDEFSKLMASIQERIENESHEMLDSATNEIESSESFPVDQRDPFAVSSNAESTSSEVGEPARRRWPRRGDASKSVDRNGEGVVDSLIDSDPFQA